jgi:hypothetical protein
LASPLFQQLVFLFPVIEKILSHGVIKNRRFLLERQGLRRIVAMVSLSAAPARARTLKAIFNAIKLYRKPKKGWET